MIHPPPNPWIKPGAAAPFRKNLFLNGFLSGCVFLIFTGLTMPVSAQPVQTLYPASGQLNPTDNNLLSARASAMGSAFVGVADDASAVLSNPAGLASLRWGEAFFVSDLGWQDAYQETLILGVPMGRWGGFGFAGSYLNFGPIEGRDSLGSPTANYSADWMMVQAGWGLGLDKQLSIGIGLHGILETIADTNYSFFAPDAGVLFMPARDLKLGLDYSAAGWGPSWGPLVATLKTGASWSGPLDKSLGLLLAVGDYYEINSLDYLQAGTEISYQSRYFVRAGYQAPLSENGYSGFWGYTFGAGLKLGEFTLDYAYIPSGNLGDINRFSLGYTFGGPPKVSPTPSPARERAVPKPVPPAAPPSQTPLGSKPAPSQAADPNIKFNLLADFTAQGEAQEAQGNHAQASVLFIRAIQQDPQNVTAWWDLGNIYFELGHKAYALQCYERVLILRPDDKAFRDWLGEYKAENP
jgi:tetratricopeptide (TPR) repeat protein